MFCSDEQLEGDESEEDEETFVYGHQSCVKVPVKTGVSVTGYSVGRYQRITVLH